MDSFQQIVRPSVLPTKYPRKVKFMVNFMALIQCPECSKSISDKSPACIHCGVPLGSSGGSTHQVEVIELTSKRFKGQFFLSVLCILGGFFWFFVEVNSNPQPPPSPLGAAMPLLTAAFGVFWYFLTKIRIWWNHK